MSTGKRNPSATALHACVRDQPPETKMFAESGIHGKVEGAALHGVCVPVRDDSGDFQDASLPDEAGGSSLLRRTRAHLVAEMEQRLQNKNGMGYLVSPKRRGKLARKVLEAPVGCARKQHPRLPAGGRQAADRPSENPQVDATRRNLFLAGPDGVGVGCGAAHELGHSCAASIKSSETLIVSIEYSK